MSNFQVYLLSYFKLSSILEIIILTFLIYQVFNWIRGTQAEQVVKGLIIILILMPITSWLGFTTLNFLIQNMFTWIFLFIIILFQPELRSVLEQLGSNTFKKSVSLRNRQIDRRIETIKNVSISVFDLAKAKTGALIICIAKTGLKEIENTGVVIDAKVDPTLIKSIFFTNAPLHDGAVIISIDNDTIEAAGCVLPLTQRRDLPQQFGTRHRAGLGVSENSDAIVIIVSEETGRVTLARNGEYLHDVTKSDLEEILLEEYVPSLSSEEREDFSLDQLQKKYREKDENNGSENDDIDQE